MRILINKKVKIIISVVMTIAITMNLLSINDYKSALAAPRTLRLSQAKNLALANSSAYRKIKNKIELKKVSYAQAVKSLKLKKKNMSTFRWTPLLSFKFPEKADLMDEYEFVYKPMQIQNEITELKHELSDTVYTVYEDAANLYTEVYGYQEKIAFEEEQLDGLEKSLEKNRNRVLLGLAYLDDLTTIEKSIDNMKRTISGDKRKFEAKKKELSNIINLDVTSNYVFSNPYLNSDVPRKELDNFVEYTLANDHSYYSAKMDTSLGLLSLDTNYDLMKKQYGGKMSYISSYVQQVKNGEKVDGSAFKSSYDKFLEAIDKPWQGKKRILFIKIPKEWFKGAIDGVRYIEDEPYGLYETALEYQELLEEEKTVAREIEKSVRDDYETLVTARNSYLGLVSQVEKEKENVNKALLLNSLGECTFEEYTEAKEQYEELQMDELESLELYTTLFYSYDRLTCGAVSKYISGQDLELDDSVGGTSYIIEEDTDVAMYYINTIIEESMFEFGVFIPEDFETDITHYELWADNYQIGTRTAIDKTIRHLMIALDDVDKFSVRVYDGENFIDECEIDTQVYQGELTIVEGYIITEEVTDTTIGTYTLEEAENTSMSKIMLNIDADEGVNYYSLLNSEGKNIFTEELMNITDSFEYLSFISGNLEKVTIKCYDKDKGFLYDAYFEPSDYSIYRKN